MMKKYTIQSYVPEKSLLLGKDARFCRTAFEDAFVLDVHTSPTVIASCKGNDKMELSMAQSASLLTVFKGDKEVLILPHPTGGSLLVYPTWPHLEMALAFLVKESAEEVEKSYQNAQRHAFSAVFAPDREHTNPSIEAKLCVLDFYMKQLFSKERQTNQAAQILMLANLIGCHLHEMSVSRVSIALDEREAQTMSAYLACTFMTLRRHNGEVAASVEGDQDPAILTHVEQEYGICIQQTVKKRFEKDATREAFQTQEAAPFKSHPAFKNYQTEESDTVRHIHIPLRQKATLSSCVGIGGESEIILSLFPLL